MHTYHVFRPSCMWVRPELRISARLHWVMQIDLSLCFVSIVISASSLTTLPHLSFLCDDLFGNWLQSVLLQNYSFTLAIVISPSNATLLMQQASEKGQSPKALTDERMTYMYIQQCCTHSRVQSWHAFDDGDLWTPKLLVWARRTAMWEGVVQWELYIFTSQCHNLVKKFCLNHML